MKICIAALAVLTVCAAAHARDAESRLANILLPADTRPAIVVRGGEFNLLLRTDASLRLESAAGSYEIAALDSRNLRGLRQARVVVPAEVPAGMYTLVASSNGGEDRNFRSVFVLDAPPDEYRVAVWSNPRVAADPQTPDTALFRVTAEINAGNPALVLVTGDLTAAGLPRQFQLALELLNDITAPTLVAPGTADVSAGDAAEYLGDYPVAVLFGKDGYLLCAPPANAFGQEEGWLHQERRRIRAARWSIGVGCAVDSGCLRDQLTIFLDDPLDAVVGALIGTRAIRTSPWGETSLYTAPEGRGAVTWFNASARPFLPETAIDESAR